MASDVRDPLNRQTLDKDNIEEERKSEDISLDTNSSHTTSNMPSKETTPINATCYLRDTIMALHRATMSGNADIRQAAIKSLVEIVKSEDKAETQQHSKSLLILQTWLEQFARTNGGSAPAEYAAPDRVRLLQGLRTVIDSMNVSFDSMAFRAAVGRAISLSTEEMTRQGEVVDEIQKPCSSILVRLGRFEASRASHIERVMDALMIKFQPGTSSHYYVVTTLSELASANPTQVVPFLKAILGTMLANMKSIKKDNLRYAYATAFSRFSEAILDYLANIDDTPDPSVTKDHFVKEIDAAHEILFSTWLSSKGISSSNQGFDVSMVRHAVIEALGQMGPLLSDDRLYKNTASPVVSTLVGLYKKLPEPFYITQCVSMLLKAMIDKDVQIVDGILEQLLTALFVQVCQYSALGPENNTDNKRRNHYEVLRCYDVLVRSHGEKLISGLILRLNSVDENVRLSTLTVIRHLMNSSLDNLQPRMNDIFNTLHAKLNEQSNRVRKMLAQLTAQLGRLGYLEGSKGQDFLEFIVKLCSLPSSGKAREATEYSAATSLLNYLTDSESAGAVSNDSLKEMCDNILQLLTNSVESMEPVLWPHLIEYLLAPDYASAIPSVVKSLSQLAARKRKASCKDYNIEYTNFTFVHGPYVLFARLIVLAAVPFTDNRGTHILSFMQNFAPNISKHLTTLWDQRIPLLQHYLETPHGSGVTWDQAQWEEWLLALVDDTVSEIDLDEWTSALTGAMCQQLTGSYSLDQPKEKAFLMRCLGRVMRAAKPGNRQIVLDNLSCVFLATQHSEPTQQAACARAFGYTAGKHLSLVLDKLEALLRAEFQRKRGAASFFSFMRDHKMEDEQLQTRCTILKSVGEAAVNAPKEDLKKKADEITQKFIMPALQSAVASLKMAGLGATADLARKLSKDEQQETANLAHHSDLIHEAIECMKAKSWLLTEKQIALVTTLELVRLPPFVSQLTRCSILKACFTAVFPSLVRRNKDKRMAATTPIDEKESLVSSQDGSTPVSSGQSTPTTASVQQSPQGFAAESQQTLDTLLCLVQALLLQELQQSTLDEIFTLLEPYLKLAEHLSREMAATILHATLRTYHQNCTGKEDMTNFSPGPYIVGSLVPRCFDTSRHVQATALQCLQLLVRISRMYCLEEEESGTSEEGDEALAALERISATCSPMTASSFGRLSNDCSDAISPTLVSRTVSNVLRIEIGTEDMLPLLHSLVDGLLDTVASSARGTSLILCNLLESRGTEQEVFSHATTFVNKLHDKISVLDSEETKARALMAVRVIAAHSPEPVVHSMLYEHRLPHDDALAEMWQVLSQDKRLAEGVMNHLLSFLAPDTTLCNEYPERLTGNVRYEAKHEGLSAIVALGTMFGMREMETIVECEFSEVLVPLLLAMSSFSGVHCCEPLKITRPLLPSLSMDNSPTRALPPPVLMPYTCASNTLQSFLTCKGCTSVATVLATAKSLGQDSVAAVKTMDFAKFVFGLVESIAVDFPMYLPKVSLALKPVLSQGQQDCHRVAAAAFYTQLAQTKTIVDVTLLDTSIDMLLMSYKDPVALVRILCVDGLSAFRLDTLSRCSLLEKHSPHILTAIMNLIGDDFDSDVNFHALNGLARVLSTLPSKDVLTSMSDIVGKIFPFFDGGKRRRDSAAAMRCFGQLALFISGLEEAKEHKETFYELVNQVLVSLLLHANDDGADEKAETRDASREALDKVLHVYQDEQLEKVRKHLNQPAKKKVIFNYPEFLREFCSTDCDQLVGMFHAHISTAMSYFRIGDPRLRANAVYLVTALLVEGKTEDHFSHIDAEQMCSAMSKLLVDGSSEVQVASAANLGKIFIKIGKDKKPKQCLSSQDTTFDLNGQH